ncbi:hypothetical protein LP420_22105 [Massilia sp. B-10]|nr:hypothetical protein LP420_22105 [Massilia sp. B-10]
MLGDPNFNALARAVQPRAGQSMRFYNGIPSYIEPRNFAIALMESLEALPGQARPNPPAHRRPARPRNCGAPCKASGSAAA